MTLGKVLSLSEKNSVVRSFVHSFIHWPSLGCWLQVNINHTVVFTICKNHWI